MKNEKLNRYEKRIGTLYLAAIAIIVASVLPFVLVSCGGVSFDPATGAATHSNVKHYNVDGKSVTCLVITNTKGTATMSCDWGR